MPSEETKERIIKVVDFGRTVLHYGWIPLIIYFGYTRSSPQPSLIKMMLHVIMSMVSYVFVGLDDDYAVVVYRGEWT